MSKCVNCGGEIGARARFCSLCGHPVATAGRSLDPEQVAPEVVLSERYRIISQLGVEGTGPVWLAEDSLESRQVAVKVLPRIVTETESSLAQVHRRADQWAKLDHPQVVKLLAWESDPFPYLVTEHVAGRPLKMGFDERIQQGHEKNEVGHFKADEVAMILPGLAEALDHAHGRGVHHLDIQPKNILLVAGAGQLQAKLTNFGVTACIRDRGLHPSKQMKLLNDGVPVYMAPEQMRGLEIDGRADIYCLAVIVFHLLTGQHPFLTRSQIGLVATMPRIPDVRPEFLEILHQAMSVRPEARFGTGREFLHAFMTIHDPARAVSWAGQPPGAPAADASPTGPAAGPESPATPPAAEPAPPVPRAGTLLPEPSADSAASTAAPVPPAAPFPVATPPSPSRSPSPSPSPSASPSPSPSPSPLPPAAPAPREPTPPPVPVPATARLPGRDPAPVSGDPVDPPPVPDEPGLPTARIIEILLWVATAMVLVWLALDR